MCMDLHKEGVLLNVTLNEFALLSTDGVHFPPEDIEYPERHIHSRHEHSGLGY